VFWTCHWIHSSVYESRREASKDKKRGALAAPAWNRRVRQRSKQPYKGITENLKHKSTTISALAPFNMLENHNQLAVISML
jgi:hypothetical protein